MKKHIASLMGSLAELLGCNYNYLVFDNNRSSELPYLIFYYPESNNFEADGIVYKERLVLVIEFYSENRDFVKEKIIEDFLTENGLAFDWTSAYIDEERMFQTVYEMEVI